jgi:4'-phosphopantetheinyl transferase
MSTRVELWLGTPDARAHFDPQRQSPEDRQRWETAPGVRRAAADWEASRALLAHAALPPGAARSLSHSGGWAALASGAAGLRLGVDLERVRPLEVERLARFAYSPAELAALQALPPLERTAHFHLLWTVKEALIKALGLRFPHALRTCTLTGSGSDWKLEAPCSGAWRLRVWRPRAELVLALFVEWAEGEPPGLRIEEWPAPAGDPWPLVLDLSAG